jgi:riboflavin transporter FmnP
MEKMSNSQQTNNRKTIRFVVGVGLFSALAYAVVGICQIIPNVNGFLSIEIKDAVITIASFIYGPLAGPIISLIVSFVEMITFSSTGPWGFLMNFVSSSVFALTASLIYKYRKSLNFAIVGLVGSVVATTLTMIALNPIIVPLYSGAPVQYVVSLITPLLLPFNFAKAMLNAAATLLLYKPLINAMRAAGMIRSGEYKTTFNKTTVISLVTGGIFLVASLIMIITLLILFPPPPAAEETAVAMLLDFC